MRPEARATTLPMRLEHPWWVAVVRLMGRPSRGAGSRPATARGAPPSFYWLKCESRGATHATRSVEPRGLGHGARKQTIPASVDALIDPLYSKPSKTEKINRQYLPIQRKYFEKAEYRAKITISNHMYIEARSISFRRYGCVSDAAAIRGEFYRTDTAPSEGTAAAVSFLHTSSRHGRSHRRPGRHPPSGRPHPSCVRACWTVRGPDSRAAGGR